MRTNPGRSGVVVAIAALLTACGGGSAGGASGGPFLGGPLPAPVAFREVLADHDFPSAGNLAWGDFDRDGDLDLAATGNYPSGIATRVYRNDGGGAFVDVGATLAGAAQGAIAWGDYDGDGDLDLVVSGWTEGFGAETHLFVNEGGGVFTPVSTGMLGFGQCALASGDCDGDGDLDLVITGISTESPTDTRLYRNDGAGVFTDVPTGIPGMSFGGIAWGDLDGDGDLDLALTGAGAGPAPDARIYRNDGGGTFTDLRAGLVPVFAGCVAWTDYDSDGDLDLALCGEPAGAARTTRLYRNDGGTFTDIGAEIVGIALGGLTWGDYDGDGDPDLALIGGEQPSTVTSRIYRNDGGGAFTDVSAPLAGGYQSAIAWGDYDGDGDLDLVSMGSAPGPHEGLHVYENTGGSLNAAPTAPTHVTVFAGGPATGVVWDAASDHESPAAALSYNLRVGTSPGGDDVAPGHAFPSGARLVAARGLIQPDPNLPFAVLHLPPGFYFVSVQAVDPGLRGSPWSAPVPFVVDGTGATRRPNDHIAAQGK